MNSINIKKDHLFKKFFNNAPFLKYFIDSLFAYLEINQSYDYTLVLSQALISGENIQEKDYYGDIIAVSKNKEIISLEMYSSTFGNREYNKSYSYACRLYNKQLKYIKAKKEDYGNLKTVYSINFMNGNYLKSNEEIINVYTMKNEKTNKKGPENIKVILIRLDKLKSIAYNINESLVIRIICLINSESIEEMRKYVKKGDKVIEEMYRYVEEFTKDLQNNSFEQYLADLKEEGKEQGQKIGQKSEKENIAKKMLAKNIDLNEIIDITGLTKKDILSLN